MPGPLLLHCGGHGGSAPRTGPCLHPPRHASRDQSRGQPGNLECSQAQPSSGQVLRVPGPSPPASHTPITLCHHMVRSPHHPHQGQPSGQPPPPRTCLQIAQTLSPPCWDLPVSAAHSSHTRAGRPPPAVLSALSSPGLCPPYTLLHSHPCPHHPTHSLRQLCPHACSQGTDAHISVCTHPCWTVTHLHHTCALTHAYMHMHAHTLYWTVSA